jgi:GntR family transcriptional regulator
MDGDLTAPVARYLQVAARLRRAILAGEYEPGEALPSESQLGEQYGLNRTTINKAIRQLAAEGLVVVEHGRGSFVRPKPRVRLLISGASYRRHRAAGEPGFDAQAVEQGLAPEQQIREVGTVSAPAEVARRLDRAEGSPVVVRRRLFLIDGRPVALCDSYYPAELAEGTPIAEPGRIKGGAHAVIEAADGPIRRRVARSVDDIISRMPTPDEITALSLLPGIPVLRVLRTIFDTEDAPIEVQDSVVTSDSHEFRYEVRMR